MAEGDNSSVSDIQLLEEELQTLQVKGETLDPKGKPSLVCSVLTEKIYNKESLKAHFKQLWKAQSTFVFSDAGPNLFVIRFGKEEDLIMVQNGRPWFFRGNLVLLKKLEEAMPRSRVTFNTTMIWIKLLDIPPGCDRLDLVAQVGRSFDGTLSSEVTKGVCKLKVQLDLSKPIRRCIHINVEGDNYMIPFTYDNLPRHCIGCGRVSHTLIDYKWRSTEEKAKPEIEQPYYGHFRSDWGAKGVGVATGHNERRTGARQRNYLAEEVVTPGEKLSRVAPTVDSDNHRDNNGQAEKGGNRNNDDVSIMETDGENHATISIGNGGPELTNVSSTHLEKTIDSGLNENGLLHDSSSMDYMAHMQYSPYAKGIMGSQDTGFTHSPASSACSSWKRRARAASSSKKEGNSTLGKCSNTQENLNLGLDEKEKKQRVEKEGSVLCDIINSVTTVGALEHHLQK